MVSSGRRFRTRHVVAISIGGMVIALSAALWLGVKAMRSADAAYARRPVAIGTIGRTGLGGKADVGEVVWQDQHHVSHTARFHFAYPDEWNTGDRFDVSYDAGDPAARVYAAPPFEDSVEDERDATWVGVFLTAITFVLGVLGWLVRGLFSLRARSAPVSEWHVQLALGVKRRVTNYIYLVLVPVGAVPPEAPVPPAGERWQRVIWSPALAGLVNGGTVRVRLRPGYFGRAVVEAPDGSLIWPSGRLRKRPTLSAVTWPASWTLARPVVSRGMLAFAYVTPFVAILRVGLSDLTDMIAFIAMMYGLWFFLWGMNGGLLAMVPPDTPGFDETAPWFIQN